MCAPTLATDHPSSTTTARLVFATEAAIASRDFERKDTREQSQKALEELKSKGMSVSELPEAEIAKLGRPFEQVENQFTKSHRGSGLGLAIVRHIVELHAGTVQAVSDGEGHGATFVVELPQPLDEVQPAAAFRRSESGPSRLVSLGGRRVLVVDDILSNVKLLEAKLSAEYFAADASPIEQRVRAALTCFRGRTTSSGHAVALRE